MELIDRLRSLFTDQTAAIAALTEQRDDALSDNRRLHAKIAELRQQVTEWEAMASDLVEPQPRDAHGRFVSQHETEEE